MTESNKLKRILVVAPHYEMLNIKYLIAAVELPKMGTPALARNLPNHPTTTGV
jgi:hypothetical protein